MDYRYFPDPDLPPLAIGEDWVERVRAALPELPAAKRARFAAQYALPDYDAGLLSADRATADYFEAAVAATGGEAKTVANWVNGELAAALNRGELAIEAAPVSAAQLGGILRRLKDGTISGKGAKEVFDALWAGEGTDADAVIAARGLQQISDSGALEQIVDEVIAANPQQVADYRAGKEKAFNSLVGQAMKATRGKANPAQVNALLKEKLDR